MFLGDSITHGEPHSYRYDLWKYMINAGWDVDFLGTVKDINEYATYKGQNFDLNHEGHPGWTASQIDSNIEEWLEVYTPDIVLYHIGTNDMWKSEINNSIEEISETIEKLRLSNPNVQIYLSKIIPIYKENKVVKVNIFNSKISALAERLSTRTSPVILVDHYSGFTENDLTGDKVHPSKSGAKKMAFNWAKILELF
ncbi:SGNH/GDSL hydrolase family protein [Seonamhaeicola sp. MEBiC1930]|uniref:SGNH/GDSL hydrolase family protein n=1 Tax=Seonamhaeicola sp. MEBiC01930 TaxID=2976768 RepID=UPI0032485A07